MSDSKLGGFLEKVWGKCGRIKGYHWAQSIGKVLHNLYGLPSPKDIGLEGEPEDLTDEQYQELAKARAIKVTLTLAFFGLGFLMAGAIYWVRSGNSMLPGGLTLLVGILKVAPILLAIVTLPILFLGYSHPRVAVFWYFLVSLLFAFSLGTVAESLLIREGVEIEGLGIYVIWGMAALLVNTLPKFHIILGAIAYIPTDASTKTPSGSASEYLAELEASCISSNKTFEPQIRVIAMILLATAYIINTNAPDLAKSFTVTFVDEHPLAVASAAVACGMFFTNSRNVWYMLGDGGWTRKTLLLLGKVRFGMVLGLLGGAAFVVASNIWIEWLTK